MTREISPERLAEMRRQPELAVERRVLAAVICEPRKLAAAAQLETDDFQLVLNRKAFEALRNLEASGMPIGPLEVAQAHRTHYERLGNDVDDAMLWHIVGLIANAPHYEDTFGEAAALGVFESDLTLLRKIANARKAA